MAYQEVYVSAPDHYHCERFMFGDRWRFGIECEVQGSEVDPWGSREPFGSFWFWVGGQVVGDPDIAEQLMHAFTPFYLPRHSHASRKASDVPGVSPLDKWGAEIFNSSANWISHASR